MIRAAKPGDSGEIKELCSNDLGYPCEVALVRERLANLDKNRECVFVAEIDGKAVGFIHVESYASMAHRAGLAVSARIRRRGIGRKLILDAEDWAKSKGISVMRLNSGASRKEAHSFYREMGFDDGTAQLRFTKRL